jgi:tetrahydromethanopterin S-methyltransferase subunit E
MKQPRSPIFSYLAALVIGMILFATFWKSVFGTASGPVVIAGIAGVVLAVLFFLILSDRKNSNDHNK